MTNMNIIVNFFNKGFFILNSFDSYSPDGRRTEFPICFLNAQSYLYYALYKFVLCGFQICSM
jgi:hypothetical protein